MHQLRRETGVVAGKPLEDLTSAGGLPASQLHNHNQTHMELLPDPEKDFQELEKEFHFL